MNSYKFSENSKKHLSTCDSELIMLFTYALATAKQNGVCDFAVIEGYRGKDKQNLYFEQGLSKVRFPESKHNSYPSKAVDILPIKQNRENYQKLSKHIKRCAMHLGVKNIIWGGDWLTFIDQPHWQLL